MKSKNDEILAIENEQRKLADRLAGLRKEPESVKPKIRGHTFDDNSIILEFPTKEQAEKAKAILERMEFGPCPFERGESYRRLCDGTWLGDSYIGAQYEIDAWHMGSAKKR